MLLPLPIECPPTVSTLPYPTLDERCDDDDGLPTRRREPMPALAAQPARLSV
jgi:hypothetical protein